MISLLLLLLLLLLCWLCRHSIVCSIVRSDLCDSQSHVGVNHHVCALLHTNRAYHRLVCSDRMVLKLCRERLRRVTANPLFSAVCGSPIRCSFWGMEDLQAEAWIWYGFGVVEAWSELGLMAIG